MPSDAAGRPAGWGRVVGQAQVKASLRNALGSGDLAHAYLFSGPSGAGMDAAAVDLARAALCESCHDPVRALLPKGRDRAALKKTLKEKTGVNALLSKRLPRLLRTLYCA